MDPTAIDKIKEFISLGPGKDVSEISRRAYNTPTFSGLAITRLNSLTSEELSHGIYYLGELAVSRSATMFAASRNWLEANSFASSFVYPLIQYYTKEAIEYIIRSAKDPHVDLNGSFGFGEFLQRVVSTDRISQAELDSILIQNDLSHYSSSNSTSE